MTFDYSIACGVIATGGLLSAALCLPAPLPGLTTARPVLIALGEILFALLTLVLATVLSAACVRLSGDRDAAMWIAAIPLILWPVYLPLVLGWAWLRYRLARRFRG
ncbi:hypothetical protein [Mameliella alba]|uniref:Transmembrane protein n=1 Tax=Mameliella alba TaxID=561184 RepID=A0A0B3S7M7_9RHOB|nr:hypothetical protein [Mameliella alba]KHQ54943.1 hypothetical protein OA50_00780 [Mameliella alba]